jgi:hypothetical protein
VFAGCRLALPIDGNGQTPKAEQNVEQGTPNVECRTEHTEEDRETVPASRKGTVCR